MARTSSNNSRDKESFSESVQNFVKLLNTDVRDIKLPKKDKRSEAEQAGSGNAAVAGPTAGVGAASPTVRAADLPTKRTMNLYYRVDHGAKRRKMVLVTLLIICVALLLAKLAVFDPWVEITNREHAIEHKQTELTALQDSLKDFDQIKQEYTRYAATDVEQGQVDRLQVLQLIQTAAASKATISSIGITGSQVTLALSDVTLAQVSEIVNALEASPLVGSVTVSTASTSASAKGTDTVIANLTFSLNDAAPAKGANGAPTSQGTGAAQ